MNMNALPAELQTAVNNALERLPSAAELGIDEALTAELPRLFAMSEFAARVVARNPQVLPDLAESGDLETVYGPGALCDRLDSKT